jgi:hypothetical protein
MARTSSVWKFLLLGTLAHASLVQAQQTPPSSTPPKLERIEEGSDVPVTITPQQRGSQKITEKREGGRVTEVQVTSGKSSYTMKAPQPGSVNDQADLTGSKLRPPQWKILEFDLSGKKKDQEAAATAEAPVLAPAPPPPVIVK